MELLKTSYISKDFGEKKIIENVSITLGHQEIVSLLGVSGVGKTTLFHIISGLMEPDKGNVFLSGQDITGKPGYVSYMLQKDLLLPYKTIEENVALPPIINGLKKKRL